MPRFETHQVIIRVAACPGCWRVLQLVQTLRAHGIDARLLLETGVERWLTTASASNATGREARHEETTPADGWRAAWAEADARIRLAPESSPPPDPAPALVFDPGTSDMRGAMDAVGRLLSAQDFSGRCVLVTAGPTREDLDPVRFLSNRSSGRMGVALARAAGWRGADVVLVHGPMTASPPTTPGTDCVPVRAAGEMHGAVMDRLVAQDVAIFCAAVADYTPAHRQEQKISKDGSDSLTLELRRTPDILAAAGRSSPRPYLVGFAAETQRVQARARAKMQAKNCDMICANDVLRADSGFGVDTNRITVHRRGGRCTPLPLLSKREAADAILDEILFGLRARVASSPAP